jgi:hypothetical protein
MGNTGFVKVFCIWYIHQRLGFFFSPFVNKNVQCEIKFRKNSTEQNYMGRKQIDYFPMKYCF